MFSSKVGLDIGSSSIRAVECVPVKKSRHGKIVNAGDVILPPGTVVSGEIRDIDTVAEALNFLWRERKFTKSRVVAGVSGENTLWREVELPWEKEELFRSSLPLRLSSELPVNAFDVELDYYPIKERLSKGLLMQSAFVTGAAKTTVLKIERAAKLSKILIRNVDYTPYAILRGVRSVQSVEGEPASVDNDEVGHVIVSVGNQITEVIIHKGDVPLFLRTTLVGSEAVTNALAERLSLPLEKAELLKRTLGLEETENTFDVHSVLADGDIPVSAIQPAQRIINVMAGALVQNVRETVEYYLGISNDIYTIDGVSLVGGGSLLPGYAERLRGELKTTVTPVDPLSVFLDTKKPISLPGSSGVEFVTAYGLAVNI